MVIDIGYWNKVIKRIIVLIISIIGIILAFKLAVFYMPFLIAFIISLLIEPIIKFLMRKTKMKRKTSAIVVFLVALTIIIGLLVWGIATLVSEASDLLAGLNGYISQIGEKIQDLIGMVDFDKIQLSDEVNKVIQDAAFNFLGTLSVWLQNALTGLVEWITSIPTIGIYTVITLLALYFICTDKIYMLDQLEHHLPQNWVRKIGIHLRQLVKTLGGYLKAEAILVIISFIISLIGFQIFNWAGLNIEYPLLVALGIGFVDALPILGSGTIMLPWAIIAAFNGDMNLGIAILGLLIVMSLVRQFMEPRIVSKQIGIHPIFTLIAMYTGYKFIGIMGMLIGPILLIILKNLFGTLIDKGIGKAIFGR